MTTQENTRVIAHHDNGVCLAYDSIDDALADKDTHPVGTRYVREHDSVLLAILCKSHRYTKNALVIDGQP